MKPEIKERWVTTLRSGRYIQGQGQLRSDTDQYCCLGVLCDLAVQDGIGEWDPLPILKSYALDNNDCSLPPIIQEWSGLYYPDKQDYLINLNDSQNQSFDQIADWIEE